MSTDTNNQEVAVPPKEAAGEEGAKEVVTLSKEDYEKMNQTLGSLKRQVKDLTKPKDEPQETSTKNHTGDTALLEKIEKMSLRQAGITHKDDIDLARATAKKWGVDIDEVLADEDFKIKLERQQTARANVDATAGVRGGQGTNQAKNDPAYWSAKGRPPTPDEVPDRKTRAKIARSFFPSNQVNGNPYYNGK